MAQRIQMRRGTAAQWTSVNPVLGAGEIGYETDTGKFKIGDGTTAWNAIASYFAAGGGTVRKIVADCAAGLTTTINHAWNTRAISVTARRKTTPWDSVIVIDRCPDANNVVVEFEVFPAPTAGEYEITVIG